MKNMFLVCLINAFTCFLLASNISILESKDQLTHDEINLTMKEHSGVSEAEWLIRDFPQYPVRPVAEFEPSSAVLIRYPLGLPLEFIRELSLEIKVITIVASEYLKNQALNAFISANVNMSNCDFIIAPTDSYWTRDYGPFFSQSPNSINVINFTYNRPRPNDNNFINYYALYDSLSVYNMSIIHTGGNYMTDGMSVATSTHIAYTENSNQIQNVNQAMNSFLGIETYFVVDDPNGDYIAHIDCWGKFLAPDKILIRAVPETHHRYQQIEQTVEFFSNQVSAWGWPYEIFRVNTPHNQPYTNSLILNDRVFVPLTGSLYDDLALQVYSQAMPGYRVIGVPNNTSNQWLATDALHCRTHEIADKNMISIVHKPLAVQIDFCSEISINAKISALSGNALINDSVRIYYKVNSSDFNSIIMNSINDLYTVTISGLEPGDTLDYYIKAVDTSGKRALNPLVAPGHTHKTVLKNSFIYTFDSGWNLFSLNIQPNEINFYSIFEDLILQNFFIKAQDQYGNSLEYLSYINQWIDGISTISSAQGYRIKTSNDSFITLNGEVLTFPLTVSLSQGWNLISMPYQFIVSSETVFRELIQNGILEKVLDEAGNSIEFLPGFGWIDNIEYLLPGKGYAVRVNTDTNLNYYNQSKSYLSKKTVVNPQYSKKSWSGNGWNHFLLHIFTDGISGEYALFDGDLCVGVVVFDNDKEIQTIICSMNDSIYEINGFIPGNRFRLKKMSKNDGLSMNASKSSELRYELLSGNEFFMPGESALIKLLNPLNETTSEVTLNSVFVYPNPFKENITLSYNLSKQDFVMISLYNIKGQKIREFIREFKSIGQYEVKLPLNNLSAGVYFISLRSSDESVYKKIVNLK